MRIALTCSLVLALAAASGCAKAHPTTTSPTTPAPASATPASVTPPPASPSSSARDAREDSAAAGGRVAALRRELDAVFDNPGVNALWGVEIQSFDTGEVLYARHAHLLLMPASNMKIVTMSVAAERLGWDYRFTTDVATDGVIAGGTLTGDLIVIGRGDPSISDRDGSRTRVFEEWAGKLKALGVTRIDGRVVGDDDALDEPAWGDGWAWDDLPFGYSAPVGALQFNENVLRLVVRPGRAGEPATAALDPEGSGLTVDARVATTAAGIDADLTVDRRPGTTVFRVTGHVAEGAGDVARTLAVENPTQYFAAALRQTLIAQGIVVSGPAIDIDDLTPRPNAARRVLFTCQSPPLTQIGTTFMKVSQNLFGETLLRTVGARDAARALPSPAAADASAPVATPPTDVDRAREAYESVLSSWGVAPGEYILRDGSGLSRYNYVTAHALVQILRRMQRDPRHAAAFDATLPIAGKDGTLASRMRATKAAGNVHAKTGSIANVRALSGYLTTANGERLGFSIIANNFKALPPAIDAIAEQAVERLVHFSR